MVFAKRGKGACHFFFHRKYLKICKRQEQKINKAWGGGLVSGGGGLVVGVCQADKSVNFLW